MDFQVKLDGVWYSLDTINQQATVINSQDRDYEGDIVIPSSLLYEGVIYNVLKIGDFAFSNCVNLGSISFPSSLQCIGAYAFSACSKINSLTFPKEMKSVMQFAFEECSGLLDIYCPTENVSSASNAFEGNDLSVVTLHVLEDTIEKYKKTEPWCRFGNIVPLL